MSIAANGYFRLIKQRFPEVDPVEKILDWVFDLAETRVVGVEATNALGIPDFGETEMFVLEDLLRRIKRDDEIRRGILRANLGRRREVSIDELPYDVIRQRRYFSSTDGSLISSRNLPEVLQIILNLFLCPCSSTVRAADS